MCAPLLLTTWPLIGPGTEDQKRENCPFLAPALPRKREKFPEELSGPRAGQLQQPLEVCEVCPALEPTFTPRSPTWVYRVQVLPQASDSRHTQGRTGRH